MSTALPTTGIFSSIGLPTDGLLSGDVGLAIVALDVDNVGDDGGWEVVASGVFPTWATFYVYVTNGGTIEKRCYSGVAGQGDVCVSADGSTLTFISPMLPVGEAYDVRIESVDGSLSATLAACLPVWKRTYTTTLYNLRASHPAPRAVGAWDINQEKWSAKDTGVQDTLYAALLTAIADTLQETFGFLLTRVYESAATGFTVLKCEGLHRWPTAGRFVLAGRYYRYTGVDAVFTGGTPATAHYCRLTGITEDDGTTPTDEGAQRGEVLMYLGEDLTDMEKLRAGFLLGTAEGPDLDTLARNYGLSRPRGVNDTVFRELLRVLIYLDAQTIYAVEKVLDVLRGPGTYEVYELFPQPGENNRFYVQLSSTTAGPRGRAYLTAFESVVSSGFTATASTDVAVLNGIWDSTDPYRAGTNYAESSVALLKTAPDRLTTASPFWTVADEGRAIRLNDGELWLVRSYLDPLTVQVGGPRRTDGAFNTSLPDRIVASGSSFRSWMVGHALTVFGTVNAGVYPIVEVVSEHEIIVGGSTFTTETNAEYLITPVFTGTLTTGALMRATIAGAVVTAPNTLPATVYLDYATTPSAQALQDNSTDGTAQFPFYLFDDTFAVALVLDIVKAAGVEAVVILE